VSEDFFPRRLFSSAGGRNIPVDACWVPPFSVCLEEELAMGGRRSMRCLAVLARLGNSPLSPVWTSSCFDDSFEADGCHGCFNSPPRNFPGPLVLKQFFFSSVNRPFFYRGPFFLSPMAAVLSQICLSSACPLFRDTVRLHSTRLRRIPFPSVLAEEFPLGSRSPLYVGIWL